MGNLNNARFRINEDGVFVIKCRVCQEEKEAEENFHKNPRNPSGHSYLCKACFKASDYGNQTRSTNLKTASSDVAQETIKILTNMKYDVEQDIHLQFLERIRTKYGKEL